MENINNYLKYVEEIINDPTPQTAPQNWQVGIDLGTADIVVMVCGRQGQPAAAFLEWTEVVRDGIVLDYWGAAQIVKKLIARAEHKLNIKIESAITSYPPGTDPQISKNVVQAAGLNVKSIIDEPSSVVHLLHLQHGAVVDIGGGTTGLAVVKQGKIIYTADEATGGRHISLVIAGHHKISFEEAEQLKRNGSAASLLPVADPVFRKMADIIKTHLKGRSVKRLYLSGGSALFPGMETIFAEELKEQEIILPYNALYLTPLAIACYRGEHG